METTIPLLAQRVEGTAIALRLAVLIRVLGDVRRRGEGPGPGGELTLFEAVGLSWA